MRYTNLELVNKCLRALRESEVSTIGTTGRSGEVWSVIEDVYHDISLRFSLPAHYVIATPSATDGPSANAPTRFRITTNVSETNSGVTRTGRLTRIHRIDFNQNDDATVVTTGTESTRPDRKVLEYKTPEEFLYIIDGYETTSDITALVSNNTNAEADANTFSIRNDKDPEFYTSFDDEYYYLDSWDSSVAADANYLRPAKIRVSGEVSPPYSNADDGYLPLDLEYQQILLREAQAMLQAIDTDGVAPKLEQQARKNRMTMRNGKNLIPGKNTRNRYGRN